MAQLRHADPCRQVGHATDPEHANPHVPRHDRLRYGRHANQIRTQSAKSANFGRRLKARTGSGEVYALMQRKALRPRRRLRERTQFHRICLGHIEEAQPRLRRISKARLIGANQRIEAQVVDVIGQQHQVANLIMGMDTARSIGQNDRLQPQQPQHPHGKGHLLRRVSLVVMHPPLHDDDRNATEQPGNDSP